MKVKTKKVVKWKRHNSCVSNPVQKKFREAAKNRFLEPFGKKSTGPSSLTVESLKKHDIGEQDSAEFDAQTFKTWATDFTCVSNATFGSVLRMHPNSAHQREILAVLAAITEVIKEQGGKETDTEYFAALMTTLETTESAESVTAIAHLLSLVIKRVPVPVLKSRFSQISKKLLDIISTYADKDGTSILKSLLLSLASLLRVQEMGVWSQSSVQHVFNCILTFLTHKKPKVRKSAQQAVKIVLKGSLFMTQPDPPPQHPAASLVAKFCVQVIESQGGANEALDTLHILGLLRDIMSTFPQNSIKSTCETVLRVMTVSNVLVTAAGLAVLHGLFSAQPQKSSLPAQLNAQIITALYDYQPSENDSQKMPAWLAVMEQAHINLVRLDGNLCISHLPKLFSVGMTCLLSERREVAQAAAKTMELLLQECVGKESENLAALTKTTVDFSQTPLGKIVRALESGLSYQFHSSWDLVLHLLGVGLEMLGKICPSLLKKCLRSMAELRETVNFAFSSQLDAAIGKAVKSIGPCLVLESIPLKFTGNEDNLDLARSWLLPIIRDNVCETELSFFTSHFLPLAARFRQKSIECTDQKKTAAAKTYESLQLQIWSMLKGFCTRPTDLSRSFKDIAKVLGTALNERPDLRMDIMAALRTLITHSKSNEADLEAVGKFSKNFVPILFNLYTSNPDNPKDPQRLAVLETTKVFFTVSDFQLVISYLDKCLSKIGEENVESFRKIALLDLAIAMVPYADHAHLKQLLDVAISNVEATDRSLQKKAYRIMEEICACSSDACKNFLSKYLDKLQELLLSSLSSANPNTRAPRLRCLIHILRQLNEPQTSFICAVVPEAILCTKVVGERARVAAYNLIIEISKTLLRWNSNKTEEEVLAGYVDLLLAGLAGSPQLISGTLLALTRVMYEYKENLSGDVLSNLVQNVCLLLKSKTREVVKAALAFIKVMLGAYSTTILTAHLSEMLSGMVSMKQDCKHHCHAKTKQIYLKLIKKFGYEAVHSMTPESVHKVLVNIRKTLDREKRQKNKNDGDEADDATEETPRKPQSESIEELLRDIDSEEEEPSNVKERRILTAKRRKGHQTWLKEETTKPEEKTVSKTAKKDHGFKVAPDGRLIITEPKDDKGEKLASDQEEDLDDLLTAIEGGSEKKRRKRLRNAEAADENENEPSTKYRAGGSGIHRPLQKKATDFGKEYRAKKAGGDIKKKGKPDPYAYVPFNFTSLNKRKQAKMKGQFANLVQGARKGAQKAKKEKRKRK
ncbi:hypothetical protein C0Q70_10152 [Pomacea canaliculata]|uniref:Uncharacterized protein n=1 Tax=Pomacea canaliculata TaxID=400727 RepID=A0A2T7PBT3_POMCA|nr:hypothetical protein C0Q70_10152 [Pomacea canaliculata]